MSGTATILQRSTLRLRRAVLVLVAGAAACSGASAVLSDCRVITGPRGVVVVLEADGQFGLAGRVQKKRGGASVFLEVSDAIYGLEAHTFRAFPKHFPVSRITVKDAIAKSSILLQIDMQLPPPPKLRLKQKGNQWLAMVSSRPQPALDWRAPRNGTGSAEPKRSPPTPSASTSRPPPSAAKPAASPPKPAASPPKPAASSRKKAAALPKKRPGRQETGKKKVASDKSNLVMLTDLVHLCRNDVELVQLHFSREVSHRTKRENGKYMIALPDVISGLSESAYRPGNSLLVDSLILRERTEGAKNWLLVTIHTGSGESAPLTAFRRDRIEVGAARPRGKTGFSMWSARGGEGVAADFVKLPRHTADLAALKQKAKDASRRDLAKKETFTVASARAGDAGSKPGAAAKREKGGETKEDGGKKAEDGGKQPAAAPAPPPLPDEQPPDPPEPRTLVVMKDNINIRNEPSTRSRESVITQLPLGTIGHVKQRKNSWVFLEAPSAEGWVYASLLRDSAKVPEAIWEEVRAREIAAEEARLREAEKKEAAAAAKAETPASGSSEPGVPEPEVSSADAESSKPETTTVVEQEEKAPRTITYRVLGRDPFISLRTKESDTLVDPQKARLVGILYDETDRLGLLETTAGGKRAFAVREGDRVEKGRVLKVRPDEVVFLLTEMGISHTYILRLAPPKRNPYGNEPREQDRQGTPEESMSSAGLESGSTISEQTTSEVTHEGE